MRRDASAHSKTSYEVLEEMWVLEEHGEPAEVGRLSEDGLLPVSLAVEKMVELGLVSVRPHPPQPHSHKQVVNPCHDQIHHPEAGPGDGSQLVEFTERGRAKASDIIRRHRLAERLFTQTLEMENEAEIEQQACKFEHILSPEATEKICTLLGHPATCPHGAPIPSGACCVKARTPERSVAKSPAYGD